MYSLTYPVRWAWRKIANLVRRALSAPDAVMFVLEGPYAELAPPRGGFLKRRLLPQRSTLTDLRDALLQVATDRRVGVAVLRLTSLKMTFAQLQSLRDVIREARDAGLRVVAWSHEYSVDAYYVACACDEIHLQHGGSVTALGFRQRYVFLADALERIGVQGDFVQISPYKTASDALSRRDMSKEARAMAAWLSDDLYGQLLEGIAAGRGIEIDAARRLVDGGPYTSSAAVAVGAIDCVVGEEELPGILGAEDAPARVMTYEAAKRRLSMRPPERPGRYVAVLRIAGDIVDGHSAQPPVRPPFRLPFVLSERAGDLTVVQQARALARDRRAAAVVVHVDSGGGSATASEAMAAALRQVAARKPVVVSMGSVAASGGYYVATPGARIVAQAATLTGSIGVLAGKMVSAGLLDKLSVHSEIVARGEHALFYAPSRPFTAEERRRVTEMIGSIYELFLDRVATSRDRSRDAIDAIGGGRVWTGRQAFEHGLIDAIGGLERAVEAACELAGLPRRARRRIVPPPRRQRAPATPTAASVLAYIDDGLLPLRTGRAICLAPIVPGAKDGP